MIYEDVLADDSLARKRINEFFSVIADIEIDFRKDNIDLDSAISEIESEYEQFVEDMAEFGEE